jgi:hypothetical protein
MPKYIVPIDFYGVIEAHTAEQAWKKVYEGLSDACGSFETAMVALGMTDVEHLHEEVQETEDE